MKAQKFLIIAMLMVFIAGLSPATMLALPMDPLEPDPLPELPEEPLPPKTGFEWSMPSRFGLDRNGDGMIDFNWDPDTATYVQTYVTPNGFHVDFDGCRTGEEAAAASTQDTFTWEVVGLVGPVAANNCQWAHVFPSEGAYAVKLLITDPAGNVVGGQEQQIEVKDLFIVSIGDSYGSGEGNPDLAQTFNIAGYVDRQAHWQDERCHRSALAGPAQAAIAVERSDSKSSVTYISLACSGATIDTPIGTAEHPEGSGVLGPYRGAVPPDPGNFNTGTFIKSQLLALSEVAAGREIDALIVSGGGNDLHFADIIADCVWHNMPRIFETGGRCHEQPAVLDRLEADLARLPGIYDKLAAELANPAPDGRPALNIKNVYLTEYPDPTRDSNGETCGSMLGEILPTTPFDFAKIHIDRDEADWARESVMGALNTKIKEAAERHSDKGWHFVTGISEQFDGHGYCADDNWVVRPYESARIQGPMWVIPPVSVLQFIEVIIVLKSQKGTMHPNTAGHRAYAKQITNALLAAEAPGPSFSTTNATGSVASRQGSSGWLTGSCENGACTSDKAVVTVSAADAAGIRAASMTVNGVDCAAVPGVTCSSELNGNTYTWTFEISIDGTYQLNLVASNQYGASSNLVHDVKVDLHDPETPTASIVTGAQGENGWYHSEVEVVMNGSDTHGGSGVALIEYQSPLINNNAVFTTVPGAPVAIGKDKTLQDGTIQAAPEGEYIIQYRAVDQSGRSSNPQTLTVRIDKTAPIVSCGSADNVWHAQDVSIACTGSDAVSGLSNENDASFALTTSVDPDTEPSGAETGSHTVCDVAGNCQTAGPVSGNKVDKKAPQIEFTFPAAVAYTLNQVVAAGYTCTDGGSGVASCEGTVANGGNLDTTSAGTKSFAVHATDNVTNTSSDTLNYDVTYDVAVLFDQSKAKKSGSTIPIKLQLQDANGVNVSDAGIILSAVKLTKQDNTAATTTDVASNANPDSNFRYDANLGGYVYNYSTKGLSAGTWALTFSVSGDPVPHVVTFDVR